MVTAPFRHAVELCFITRLCSGVEVFRSCCADQDRKNLSWFYLSGCGRAAGASLDAAEVQLGGCKMIRASTLQVTNGDKLGLQR